MTEVRIIPAILTSSVDELTEKTSRVAGLVERAQIDIVGRVFSPEVSVGLEAIAGINVQLLVDVQLMVREPVSFLGRCEQIGVERIFGHVEYMRSQEEFIDHASAMDVEVGLAVDLPTPVSRVERNLSQIDALLLMAVPAGKSGQKFDEHVLDKIVAIRSLEPMLPIVVDGGITPSNIGACVERGAMEFAVGSFLWESEDVKKALGELRGAGSR